MCNNSFLARRDAKTCSPTCRKRRERTQKLRLADTVKQVEAGAQHLETEVKEEFQHLAASFLPMQVAYAGAAVPESGFASDEETPEYFETAIPQISTGPKTIDVSNESSAAHLIEPTILQGGAAASAAKVVVGTDSGDRSRSNSLVPDEPDQPSKQSFRFLSLAVLFILLLLGAGLLVTITGVRHNDKRLGQIDNTQQSQNQQQVRGQAALSARTDQLEVRLNALDAKIDNLKVGSSGDTTVVTGDTNSGSAALGSDVTKQGNTFNGAGELVQLDSNGLLPTLDGSQLTNVNATTLQGNSASYYTTASHLSSGTLADGRLSGNVALLNAANAFTGSNSFSSTVVLAALGAAGNTSLCLNGSNQIATCASGGAGVSSLDGLIGGLTIANSSGSGTTITINDASTSQKGIAQFNATNFKSDSPGVINTIQNIAIGSSPTFTGLTLSGLGTGVVQATSGVLSTGNVALGSQTTGTYVTNLGALTGLTTTGNSGPGGITPTLSVSYGALANTATQGNSVLSFTGTGNLQGTVSGTAGGGFTTNTLDLATSPIITGTLAVQGAGGITVGSTANPGSLKFLDGTADGFNASIGLSAPLTGTQAFTLPTAGGVLCTTTTCAAGSSSGYVQLQGTTPGTPQTGNLNITGTGILGALSVTNAATVGTGLTVSAGGANITGGLTSAGTTTLSALNSAGVVHNSAAGVLSSSLIVNADLQGGTYAAITGTGALAAGSIASGFGTISTGNTITTTTTLQGATVVATGALQGNSLSINSGAFAVNSAGAITAATGIASSGAYTQTGSSTNTFSGATNFTAGSITLGVAGTTPGSLNLANGTNTNLSALQAAAPTGTGTATYILPSIAGGTTGTLCTTTTCAAGSGSTYVQLQGATPGTAQTGNLNITGTGIVGALNVTNAATIGTGLTVTTGGITVQGGGIAITGNSTIAGTLGSLTSLSSSGTITFSGLNAAGVVHNSAAGVLSTSLITNADLLGGTYTAITGTGALAAGSIASGFGTISTGNNITTTAALQGGTATLTGANALTLGTASSNTGAIVFKGQGGTGTLTLQGPTTPNAGNFTLSLPAITGNDTVCTLTTCAAATGGNYIAKNTNDTSSASFAGDLLALSNTNTGAAGVLRLNNSGTGSGLYVTEVAGSNPTAGRALIRANNLNTSGASGNLLELDTNSVSQFAVDAGGNVTVQGSYNSNTFNSSSLTFGASGTATVDSASGQALQLGTGANAHNVTVGNTTGSSSLTLQAGSGGASLDSSGVITIGANATSVAIGNTTNSAITENVKSGSTTAYQLQSTSTILLADTSNTNYRLYVGAAAGSTTPPLLVLGNKTSSGDPTYNSAFAGAMYYNSNTGNFRCADSGTWINCIGGLLSSNTSASTTLSNCGSLPACAAFSNSGTTLPAGYCTSGRVIHIFASGIYSNTSTPVLDFGVYIGTDPSPTGSAANVEIGKSNQLQGGNTVTNVGWTVDFYIICDTSGTSTTATVTGNGTAQLTKSVAAGSTSDVIMYSKVASGATINTTVDKNIYLFPLWGNPTNTASNTVTCYQFIVTGT
jgi:fibronectin-binding autotransporter adhesin